MTKEGYGKNGRRKMAQVARLAALLLTITPAVVYSLASTGGTNPETSAPAIEFTDVRQHTKDFMAYNRSVTLTPEQELIKRQALTGLPAPCCSNKTANTCCCSCNMARTWWGLSKHLIANKGYDVQKVRAAVSEWIRFINPDGFSGNACYQGGCNRSFDKDGCGGMKENQLVF